MNLFIAIASTAILVSLYRASTNNKVPQSPAACGIAFFIITAGTVSWLYLLSALPDGAAHLVANLVSLPILATWSGYAAARTTEDTAFMNAKIVAGASFIPYSVIMYFSLDTLPSFAGYYAVAILVPCMLLGVKLYQWSSNLDKE